VVKFDLVENVHHCGEGVQRMYTFENGTQVSAIKTPYSYGGKNDKWEIAVLDANGDWLTRDVWHDLSDDVMGHVSDELLPKYIEDVYFWDLDE